MRTLTILLWVCSVFASAQTDVRGSEPVSTTPPNVPRTKEQILVSARKVTLIGAVGHVAQWGLALNPSEKKAQEILNKEVAKWGRFTVIPDPAQADLVLVLMEGNRAAGGGGVIRTARLVVQPGGKPPKPGDIPLWDEDANGSILATSGAPKVIARFRAYLENLDKTVSAVPAVAPPAAETNTPAPAVPAPATVTPPPAAANTVSLARPPAPKLHAYTPPFEIISRGKTYTLRGVGADGKQGTFDKVLGVGKYSDIQSAMGQIHDQMSAWGQMEYVKEVPEADLVIVVYQWDTRTNSRQFHGIQSAVQVAEGREAFQREDPALWVSGTVNGAVPDMIGNLRFEMDQSTQLAGLSASHNANKNYNHGSDWIESALKKKGHYRSDPLFEAVAELRKSLRADYGYAPAHERLAAALQELGFHCNAAYEYKLALQLQPGMQDALRGLIEALAAIPDYPTAREAAQELIRSAPTPDNYLKLGGLQLSNKDYAAAEASFQDALRLDPNSADAHFGLARALYRDKRTTDAEKEFREALRLRPDNEDVMVWLGATLNDEQKPEEAATFLRQALAQNSKRGSIHYQLALALRAQKRYEESLGELRACLQLEPTAVLYHRELARTLASAGKSEEALSKFREIAEHLPEDATAHLDLGMILLAQAKTDAALIEFERAVQLDPNNATAHFQLGRAKEAKGDAAGAQAAYDHARSLDPQNEEFQKAGR